MVSSIAPPSPALLVGESLAGFELVSHFASMPWLELVSARGDGHPVLVIPGWMTGDRSTALLRAFLRRRGYAVHGWRLGQNVGMRPGLPEDLAARLLDLRRRHRAPVSLVGQSLGGVYARGLARRFPDDVRQVITLGSPLRDLSATRVSNPSGRSESRRRFAEPIPAPSTSIYSRTDGIVSWRNSLLDAGRLAENVEVRATHIGMGANPAVLYAVADRLAQPRGSWSPFVPPILLRFAFPAR